VDVRLDEVVLRALERDRDRRYQRVDEVKTGVESIADSRPIPVAAPAPAASSPASTRLSKLAVASLLCWPLALLTGFVVYALGSRDEIGVWAGVSVAITGFILSMISYHAIRREPDRLHGLRLAKIGFMSPLILGAVGLVGVLVLAMVFQARDARRAERNMLQAREQAELEGRARELLSRVASMAGMTPMDEIAELVDPRRREWFEELAGEEFKNRYDSAQLGLAMIDVNALPAPLSNFRVTDVGRDGDRAYVELRTGRNKITYSMVRVDGDWYLEICPLGIRFPDLQGRELESLRRRFDVLIKVLPKEPTREQLELILPAVDPAKHYYVRNLDSGEYTKLMQDRQLGAAFLSASEIPGGSWSLRSNSGDVKVKDGIGTYTLWGQDRSFRVTLPVVRTNGKWYLAVGPVEIVKTR